MLVCNVFAGVMPAKKMEKNTSPSMTEQAGYVPTDRKIKEFFECGVRLKEARAAQYDFPPGVEPKEDFSDPTRAPGFDLADATQMARQAEAKVLADAREGTVNAQETAEPSPEPTGEPAAQQGAD